jgi:hypothetical protein
LLAYVFWHWRRPEVDRASYVERLIAFHEALGRASPSGFLASVLFRGGPAPWVTGGESFEDWYLTEGSAALDPLNDGSISGGCRLPHDQAARSAAGGTAGLYRLRLGSGDVAAARTARWLSKPSGTSYGEFQGRLGPWAERPGCSLWGRQMTLGPTPEFCLLSPDDPGLPGGLVALARSLEILWPRV